MLTLRPGVQRCPAHPDRGPSLSVSQAADGRWLLHCFAGCDTAAVLEAGGLTWADLAAPGSSTSAPRPRPRPARPLGDLAQARAVVLARADRARAKRLAALPEWEAAGKIRVLMRRAELARAWATRLGDTPGGWALAEAAARWERLAGWVGAAMDTGD